MTSPPPGSAHNGDVPTPYPRRGSAPSPYDEPTVAHSRPPAGAPHAGWGAPPQSPLPPPQDLPPWPAGGITPQPAARTSRRWPAIAVTATAALVATAATGVLVQQVRSPTSEQAPLSLPDTYRPPRPVVTTTTPEPEPNAVHAGQLGGILGLGAGSGDIPLDAVLGVPLLRKTSEFFGLGSWTSDRQDCGGVLFPSLRQGYDDSGFKNTRMHGYVDTQLDDTDNHMLVEQQATAFYTTAAATEFVTKAVEKWGKCANQVVTLNKPNDEKNPHEPYTVGTAAMVDAILTVTTTREGRPEDPWQCQHSLTSRRNVVIDVAICAPTGSTQAPLLARWTTDRVPQ
jgi:hypothetical protein